MSTRITGISTAAIFPASDDYLELDGATNASRKMTLANLLAAVANLNLWSLDRFDSVGLTTVANSGAVTKAAHCVNVQTSNSISSSTAIWRYPDQTSFGAAYVMGQAGSAVYDFARPCILSAVIAGQGEGPTQTGHIARFLFGKNNTDGLGTLGSLGRKGFGFELRPTSGNTRLWLVASDGVTDYAADSGQNVSGWGGKVVTVVYDGSTFSLYLNGFSAALATISQALTGTTTDSIGYSAEAGNGASTARARIDIGRIRFAVL